MGAFFHGNAELGPIDWLGGHIQIVPWILLLFTIIKIANLCDSTDEKAGTRKGEAHF